MSAPGQHVAVSANPSRLTRLLPLIIIQLYLNATVAVFAWGPWPWPVAHPVKLYGYLMLAHLMVILGYLSGSGGRPRPDRGQANPVRLLWVSLVLNLLLIGPTVYFKTGSEVTIADAINNPALAYYAAAETASTGKTINEIIRMFAGPLTAFLLPLTGFFWERLTNRMRLLCVCAMLLNLSVWLMTGTNKGLADFIMLLPWLVLTRIASGKFRLRLRHVLGGTAAFAVLMGAFIAYFSYGQQKRQGDIEVPYAFGPAGIWADMNGPVMRSLPPSGQGALRGLTVYATQGYYGLGLALDKPFVSTYGFGYSMMLQNVAKKFTGTEDIMNNTYGGRLEKEDGFGRLQFWYSIYPWFASDVGFSGALVVVFLLGRLLAVSWLDIIGAENLFALPLFLSTVITFLYFSANNPVLSSPEGFSSFYILLIVWWWRRKRVLPPLPAAQSSARSTSSLTTT